MQMKEQYMYYEWDRESFVLPNKYILNDDNNLADALSVFYSVGGYDFFNVVDPRYYSDNWLSFVGDLYEEITRGKYASGGKCYMIPLSKEQKQELAERGVPEVFVTDIR